MHAVATRPLALDKTGIPSEAVEGDPSLCILLPLHFRVMRLASSVLSDV